MALNELVVGPAVGSVDGRGVYAPRRNAEERSPDRTHVRTASGPHMRQLFAVAARVAEFDSTVLITGESGVGKERLARFLHDQSPRRRGPFVAINCGACAETLLESELFGHSRGAFTGAVQDRIGMFEAAEGGTLFLDEIGDISSAMQLKLLRVVQERELRRIGEMRSRRLDIRLVAATNRDLRKEVAAQRFRHDLYYRLHVVDLVIPPLRERPEDIRAIAHDCLAWTAARLRRQRIVGFAPDALARLLAYSWPGNVRELEHAIECAVIFATGCDIQIDDLPEAVRCWGADVGTARSEALHRTVRGFERQHILTVLDHHRGDRRLAAAALGISLSTLKRRLRGPVHERENVRNVQGAS